MKSRDASPEPNVPKPGLTWLVVPLAALGVAAVLGLALFADPSSSAPRTLTGGPLVERSGDDLLPRAEPPPAVAAIVPVAPPLPPLPTADEVAPMTLSSASRMVPIEVYTATWCSACANAERWMDDNDISYSEIDVDRHPGARDQLLALNPRRTLPTFDVAGDVLVGFDPLAPSAPRSKALRADAFGEVRT